MANRYLQVLVDGDVAGMRRLWRETLPQFPQPANDAETEVMLHHARTQCEAVPVRLRAWSHRWLVERGLPSGLPDIMRPGAERMYPRDSVGVGISVNARSPITAPIVPLVRRAMEDAVLEAEADGRLLDSPHVKARMNEARARTVRKLVGI